MKFTTLTPADPEAVKRVVAGVAQHRLRVAVLCAAGSLAACAPPTPKKVARADPAPSSAPAARVTSATQEAARLSKLPPVAVPHVDHPPLDRSGRKEIGKASYYAKNFDGRKTADGQRFNPNASTAASKTLPIGTTARVINLSTGKAATVTVNDRGPFVPGRVLDVTPKVASKLDMTHAGVARVVVEPIRVPQSNGAVKLGAGAAAPSGKIKPAVQTTKQATPAGNETTDP